MRTNFCATSRIISSITILLYECYLCSRFRSLPTLSKVVQFEATAMIDPHKIDGDILCGIGQCRPKWLQVFASSKWYLIVHCIMAITQGMMFTYMSGILSTLEKAFGLRSEYSAYVMSGNELSQFLLILFLPCINRVKRRPLWVGIGNLVSVVGCFIISLAAVTPYDLGQKVAAFNLTAVAKHHDLSGQLCEKSPLDHDALSSQGVEKSANVLGISFIFIGLFLTGFGNTVYFSLSVSYLDDNVSRQFSPFMLAISMLVRVLGPFLGVALASACLQWYVDPANPPNFKEDDPRWIGAWWLGTPIIGVITMMMAFMAAFFPRRMPATDDKHNTDATNRALRSLKSSLRRNSVDIVIDEAQKSWDDAKGSLKRLSTNKIFVLNLLSAWTTMFIFSGFGTFMPKFYQVWFRFRASKSSVAMVGSIIGQLLGMLSAGYVLSRKKPRATYVCLWNVLGSVVLVVGLFGISNTSCDRAPWIMKSDSQQDCLENCGCKGNDYNPICLENLGLNFHSACAAGCTSSSVDPITEKVTFHGCSCIKKKINNTLGLSLGHPLLSQTYADLSATKGECASSDEACYSGFYIFTAVISLITFFISSGRVGSLLIQLRAIETEDKAVALAIASATVALFGQLPGPLVYGYLFDQACLMYRSSGNGGDCLQYDSDKIRDYIIRVSAGLSIIPLIIDTVMARASRRLDLYVEPKNENMGGHKDNEAESVL